jgi:hypothetical protein
MVERQNVAENAKFMNEYLALGNILSAVVVELC